MAGLKIKVHDSLTYKQWLVCNTDQTLNCIQSICIESICISAPTFISIQSVTLFKYRCNRSITYAWGCTQSKCEKNENHLKPGAFIL